MWFEVAASDGNKKSLRSERRVYCKYDSACMGASWQCNMAPTRKVDMCVWPVVMQPPQGRCEHILVALATGNNAHEISGRMVAF